jgi:hypothetical protein
MLSLEKDTHPNGYARRVSPFQCTSCEVREASAFPPAPAGRSGALSEKPLTAKNAEKNREGRQENLPSPPVPGYSLGQRRSETPINYRGFGQEMLAGSCLVVRCPWGLGRKLKTQRTRRKAAEGAEVLPFGGSHLPPHGCEVLCAQCVFEKSASPTSTKRPLGFGNCSATASCSGFCWVFGSGESSFLKESACCAGGCSLGVAVRAQIP